MHPSRVPGERPQAAWCARAQTQRRGSRTRGPLKATATLSGLRDPFQLLVCLSSRARNGATRKDKSGSPRLSPRRQSNYFRNSSYLLARPHFRVHCCWCSSPAISIFSSCFPVAMLCPIALVGSPSLEMLTHARCFPSYTGTGSRLAS